jgi:trans-2,3-dihydro-3-hydroxyanthranilate isomerase
LTGNQLAVFPAADSLDTAMMQRIALEMALSETTFVFPPEYPETDCRVRIFTPRRELPMAGHPTIGTTFALAHDRFMKAETQSITLGLGIGPTPVTLEWDDNRLHFAWMTQPLPEFGAVIDDVAGIAASLRVAKSEIYTTLPIQVVSCGLPFLYVPLVSRDTVNDAEFDRGEFLQVCRNAGIDELPVFLFALETDGDPTAFSRLFASGFGIPEDPATGGAGGPLGSYLLQHGELRPDQASHLLNLQGVKMRRPSRIHISIGERDGRITSVRVGGLAVLVGEGRLQI